MTQQEEQYFEEHIQTTNQFSRWQKIASQRLDRLVSQLAEQIKLFGWITSEINGVRPTYYQIVAELGSKESLRNHLKAILPDPHAIEFEEKHGVLICKVFHKTQWEKAYYRPYSPEALPNSQ